MSSYTTKPDGDGDHVEVEGHDNGEIGVLISTPTIGWRCATVAPADRLPLARTIAPEGYVVVDLRSLELAAQVFDAHHNGVAADGMRRLIAGAR